MEKEDYIGLIKVAEGIMTLEKGCKILSGVGFDEGKGNHVFDLWEILRRNAAEHFRYSNDLEQDVVNYREFSEILQNEDLSPEEKYNKLME